jgi:hypothetical protein
MVKRLAILVFLFFGGQVAYSQLDYSLGIEQPHIEDLYPYGKLKFVELYDGYDNFFLFNDYVFYSSYLNKEIVVKDSNLYFQVEKMSTEGIHEILYYPVFYSDGTGVFFKRSLISNVIGFKNKNGIWAKNELNKLDVNYQWVYYFENTEILVFYSDGVPERQNNPDEFATIYYKQFDSSEYKTLMSITLDNFPSRLTTSRYYKPLYVVVTKNKLVVFDNHNQKLIVYDEGFDKIIENNLDYGFLNCKIREYSDKTPPISMITIKQDLKTDNLYFFFRAKHQKKAVLWKILFNDDFSISGYKEAELINNQDFEFQQVYDNRVYYLVDSKIGKFMCYKEILE